MPQGLIDNGQMAVLPDNFQRQRFRLRRHGGRRGNVDANPALRVHREGGLGLHAAVHARPALAYQQAGARAGQPRFRASRTSNRSACPRILPASLDARLPAAQQYPARQQRKRDAYAAVGNVEHGEGKQLDFQKIHHRPMEKDGLQNCPPPRPAAATARRAQKRAANGPASGASKARRRAPRRSAPAKGPAAPAECRTPRPCFPHSEIAARPARPPWGPVPAAPPAPRAL